MPPQLGTEWARKTLKKIESVQRRATAMVLESRSLEYHERIKELNLTKLLGTYYPIAKTINSFKARLYEHVKFNRWRGSIYVA